MGKGHIKFKKIIVTSIIFFFFVLGINSEDQPKLINRKVVILPFLNINDVKKHAYISDSLRDALSAELLHTDMFKLSSFAEVDGMINILGYTQENCIKESNAIHIASRIRSDVVIIGTYIIIGEKIKILIKAIDIHKQQLAININVNGYLGLDLFDVIDNSAKQMAIEMMKKLPPMTDEYFKMQKKLYEEQRKANLKKIFSPRVKIGISLASSGGALFIIGLPLLIYDLVGYSDIVRGNLYENPRSNIGYDDYQKAAYIYISLFATSISLMGVGLTLMAVGIPLFVSDIHKRKKKGEISLNISYDKDLVLSFNFKF